MISYQPVVADAAYKAALIKNSADAARYAAIISAIDSYQKAKQAEDDKEYKAEMLKLQQDQSAAAIEASTASTAKTKEETKTLEYFNSETYRRLHPEEFTSDKAPDTPTGGYATRTPDAIAGMSNQPSSGGAQPNSAANRPGIPPNPAVSGIIKSSLEAAVGVRDKSIDTGNTLGQLGLFLARTSADTSRYTAAVPAKTDWSSALASTWAEERTASSVAPVAIATPVSAEAATVSTVDLTPDASVIDEPDDDYVSPSSPDYWNPGSTDEEKKKVPSGSFNDTPTDLVT